MKKVVENLNLFEEGVLAFTLLGLAVLTFVETALRYSISYTFPWFNEFANYMMIFCTYLGASVGVKYGTHFSMEAVTEYASDRVSHALKVVANLFSALITLVFCYYGVMHIQGLMKFDVKSSAMQIPMYWPYIPIAVFSVVMSFRFLALSWKHVLSLKKGEPFQRVRRK